MYTVKIITTIFNILFAFIIFYFKKNLRWKRESDKASIIGFWMMIGLYALNIICMWV